MQNCKKCVHYAVCVARTHENTLCDHFKNKSDFQEVKHGEWKAEGDCGITRCSVCGWTIEECIEDNYCRNCGAIMDCKNEILPKRCKCGSEAELVKERDDKHQYYYVYCTGCEKTTGQFATDVEAVNCWNGENTSE